MEDRELRDPVLDGHDVPPQPQGSGSGCLRGCLVVLAGLVVAGIILAILATYLLGRLEKSVFSEDTPLVTAPAGEMPKKEESEALQTKIHRFAKELSGPAGKASIELSAGELNEIARTLSRDPMWKEGPYAGLAPTIRIDLTAPKTFDVKITRPVEGKNGVPPRYLNLRVSGEVTVHEGKWELKLGDTRLGNWRLPMWLRDGFAQSFDPREYSHRFRSRSPDVEIVNLEIRDGGLLNLEVKNLSPDQHPGKDRGTEPEGPEEVPAPVLPPEPDPPTRSL